MESFGGEGKPLLRKEYQQDELGFQANFLLEIKEQKTFLWFLIKSIDFNNKTLWLALA